MLQTYITISKQKGGGQQSKPDAGQNRKRNVKQEILVSYLPSTLDLYCQLEAAGGSPGHLARLLVTEPNSILLSFPIQIVVKIICIDFAKHEVIATVSKASEFQFCVILENVVQFQGQSASQVQKFISELTKSWCKHPLLFLSIPEQEHSRLFIKQKSSSLSSQ